MDNHFTQLTYQESIAKSVSIFLENAGHRKTLRHIQAVEAEARTLASDYGANVEAASIAAWCHDLAVVVPHAQIIDVAEAWGVTLTAAYRAVPQVLHGPLAAEVVHKKLGIADEDILNAIRHHTTLRAGASLLEKVVFVADKVALDPTSPRDDFQIALNAALDDGIDAAAFAYIDWVVQNNDELGWTLHEHLLAAHAELKANDD